ncbi:murein L,D-transpeptidase catalytic domain family protein [Sphingomonas sp. SUN039]|uniref:murein L,D-transpeptidase catalytic domain family protein n=1 Tax=Sphingomonas sp. SUN039 TaxID=2937787 RepID=UPI0038D42393
MDRRDFAKQAIAAAGFAALPVVARAQLPGGPPPSVSTTRYAPLLARARAALDRHHSQFDLRDRVALADFSIASRDMRFHIVDLISGQSWSYLVAHGKGSDPEHTGYLQRFSNDMGSLATSAGTYKTGDIYFGVHGRAMRLIGLEPTNDLADPRAIVIHGAPYATEDHVAKWGKLGRSEGCFAVAPHMLEAVLGLLGPGRMLFADKV